MKFIKLRALPVSIEPLEPEVLVRLHVEIIEEGEERWRG
jgi:hypothetical protein